MLTLFVDFGKCQNPAVSGPPERKVERFWALTRRGEHVGWLAAHNFSWVSKPTPRHLLSVMSRVVLAGRCVRYECGGSLKPAAVEHAWVPRAGQGKGAYLIAETPNYWHFPSAGFNLGSSDNLLESLNLGTPVFVCFPYNWRRNTFLQTCNWNTFQKSTIKDHIRL